MREPLSKRDQREIVLSGESRNGRSGAAVRRIPLDSVRTGGWRSAVGTVARGTGRLCLRRPGEIIGSIVIIGAVAAVSMNALGFQGGRHPAPFFVPVAARPEATASSRKPAAAKALPADAASAGRDTAKVSAAPDAKPGSASEAETRAARSPGADTIAEIIRAGETIVPVGRKPEHTVARAQRALVKLGYGPLKSDGVPGPATRAAIERFERDRKLPVKGEAGGRTLRELAARSGLPPG